MLRVLGKKRVNPVTDEQIVAAYNEERSAYRVAKKLGVAGTTVYRVLHKRGIAAIGLKEYRDRITRFQGQEEAIRAMYDAGHTHQEIKQHFGEASDYAIKHAIRRAGGELRINPAPTIKDGEREKILELRAAGKSQQQIAIEISRSQGFVGRILNAAGVEQGIRRGENHGQWKGGRMHCGDYWRVKVDADDPYAAMRNNQGYVLEHRIVMARKLGRVISPKETVHHINGDCSDNRPENLQLRQGRHGKGQVMVCRDCGSHNIGHATIN